MNRAALILPLLALALSCANGAIDLTPAISEYKSEGFVYQRVTFAADDGSITYVPPQGWSVRGSKNLLQLTAPGKKFAEGTIAAVALPTGQAFDEPTVRALEQQVLAEVPFGSQSLQVVSREENPVPAGQNVSYKFEISYSVLGQVFQRSVIFVHTAGTQLVFRFSAPKETYNLLNSAFRASIASWQRHDPGLPRTAAITAANQAASNLPR